MLLVLESGSSVVRHDGGPLLLLASSSELSASSSFLLLPATFRELRQVCALPIALCQRERGSKFSRRPQVVFGDFGRGSEAREPCIGQGLLGRRATRGFGIGVSTDKPLGCGVGARAWMSDRHIPTSRNDPVRTFVSYVLPAIGEVCPHLRRLLYHLHPIFPE